MIRIKYNNQSVYEKVAFERISEHIVALKGASENGSGFNTYKLSGEQLGDFSDYITTYRLLDGEVQYSNDGSTYVEPEPVKPQPTQNEKEKTLIKAQIQALSERNDFLEDCVAEMASIVYA